MIAGPDFDGIFANLPFESRCCGSLSPELLDATQGGFAFTGVTRAMLATDLARVNLPLASRSFDLLRATGAGQLLARGLRFGAGRGWPASKKDFCLVG